MMDYLLVTVADPGESCRIPSTDPVPRRCQQAVVQAESMYSGATAGKGVLAWVAGAWAETPLKADWQRRINWLPLGVANQVY